MRLPLRLIASAAAIVAVGTGSAYGLMIAFKPPVQCAISAEVVIVGKVTGFEKDVVKAERFPGDKEKGSYKVAVVKVETGLVGAEKMKEFKIGFIPPPKPEPNAPNQPGGLRPGRPRPGFQTPELKEGQEMLFFLAKHPTADFYVIPGMSPPVEVKDEQGKKELEAVKKIIATLADPMKGLKSDKAEVRAETAAALVMKYRAYPETGGEIDQVAIAADESKLILKGLADGEWSNNFRPGVGNNLNPTQAFYSLGLNQKDGWVQPVIAPQPPGAPPVDFNAIMKDAFTNWLDGPGKDYVVKKVVAKKKAEK